MNRAEIERWLAGHEAAAQRQRELLRSEPPDLAPSLALIAALRATVPPESILRQRAADDERVRQIWARLRQALR